MCPLQLLLLLSNYTTSLEADKQKLKAQVKRLCAENNWLRKELTDHQQLLLDTELALARAKEDKEHLDFLLAQQKVRGGGEGGGIRNKQLIIQGQMSSI